MSSTWVGRDTTFIAESLLATLRSLLDLDIACLHLDGVGHRFTQFAPSLLSAGDEVAAALGPWLETGNRDAAFQVSIKGAKFAVLPSRLGITTESGIGLLLTRSRRREFPNGAEGLTLTLAANLATVAFREVRERANSPLPTDTRYRDLTESALPESERQLKLFIDTIPVAAWCATADGMAEFFNQHYLDYVGRSYEDLQGLGYLSQFHPDDFPGLLAIWQDMLASKLGGDLEGRVRRADGVFRWTLIRTTPLLDGDGNVVRWYGITTDIEDRKRAEDLLSTADVRLGGMSGLQLQIELIAIGRSIPVVIVTAFSENGYRAQAMNAGAVEFLSKPISAERLPAAVEAALSGKRPDPA